MRFIIAEKLLTSKNQKMKFDNPYSFLIPLALWFTRIYGIAFCLIFVVPKESKGQITLIRPVDKTVSCGDHFSFDIPLFFQSCPFAELQSNDEIINICGGTESISRTWKAKDECGDFISCTQTITIIDEEPPVFISFPKDILAGCQDDLDFGTPEVGDNCGQVGLIFIDDTKGNCYHGITISRTWSAVDGCGNATNRIQIIELLPDDHTKADEKEAATTPVFDDVLHIFPNPASHMVNLKFYMEKGDEVQITIYDFQGKTVFESIAQLPAGQQSKQIETTRFSNGSYIVMIEHNGKWLSRQFVKE